MPYQYTTERVHITRVVAGDTVLRDGAPHTVGLRDIHIGGLFGRTLFGDSYRAGTVLVERCVPVRALPR